MVSSTQLPSSPVARRPKPIHPGSSCFGRGSSEWLYFPFASACQISSMASSTGTASPSSTRNVTHTRFPRASGPATQLRRCSSVVSSIAKNGPTVCEDVGTRSVSGFKWSRLRTAQHDIELETLCPLRLCGLQIEFRDQPLSGSFIRYGLEDGVVGKQWIARKVHLCNQARDKRGPKDRKVNVCRPPRVVMIEPGICAGLDGDEAVRAMCIGQGSPRTTKVRIERGGMLVLNMPIPSGGVRLPNLDECIGNGPPVAVENAPAYDDAFTDWLTCVLAGQIVIVLPNFLVPKNGSGNFRKRVWQHNKGLQWCPFDSCAVRLVQGQRLTALG